MSVAPSRRIVVVEDHADARAALELVLQLEGHRVRGVADGQEAVDVILAEQPDVAFVDIGLPGMDGHEVARRLRAAPGGRDLVLIALTGYGRPDDANAGATSRGASTSTVITCIGSNSGARWRENLPSR